MVSRRISPFERMSVKILALPSLITLSFASPASGPATDLSISGLMTLLCRVSLTKTAGRLPAMGTEAGAATGEGAADPTVPLVADVPTSAGGAGTVEWSSVLLALTRGPVLVSAVVAAVVVVATAAMAGGAAAERFAAAFFGGKGVALRTFGPFGVI